MFRIKRTKGGNVAYATAVRHNGAVYGWHTAESKAVPVTEGMAKAVIAYYRGQANVGELTAEAVKVDAETLAKATTKEADVKAEHFATLQAECRRLRAESEELVKQSALAANALEAARRGEQDAVRRLTDLEELYAAKCRAMAELTAVSESAPPATEAGRTMPQGGSTAPPRQQQQREKATAK